MHTFLTPEPITVEIRNASGEIRVDLADVATTTVDVVAGTSHPLGFLDDVIRAARNQFAGAGGRSRFGSPFDGNSTEPADDPAERVRVDLREPAEGGAATLIVDTDPARDGWKTSFTVHVTAPIASGIRVQSQSADVTMTGRAERFEARTASGKVVVEEVTGHCVVQSASGDVSVAAGGDCDLRSASGNIDLQRVSGDAVVHSTSGDVRIDQLAGNVNARSVSGDIRLRDVTAGSAQLTSVSGDVEIGIHPGTVAAVDLSTVSGNTDSDFDVSDEAPTSGGFPPAAGTDPLIVDADTVAPVDDATANSADNDPAGSPLLDLRVKTTSGDIRLRRAVALA